MRASLSSSLRIVAAFAPELGAVSEKYRASTRVVGVGMCEASARTALLVAAESPSVIVLVGTCGVYPGSAIPIGSAIVGDRFCLVDAGHAVDRAAFPAPMQIELAPDEALVSALADGGARGSVATTLAVTTDDVLAAELATRGRCAFEHLEVFGVAQACAVTKTRFAVVLGIANAVGSTGRAEWRANHERASSAAVAVVERWLDRGAPGL